MLMGNCSRSEPREATTEYSRSIKREKNADKEIARLNDINNQLTDQLDLLSKGQFQVTLQQI